MGIWRLGRCAIYFFYGPDGPKVQKWTPELFIHLGGAKGQAADFEIFDVSNQELVIWIDQNLDYDQMILEFHNVDEPNSGWVHCSYRSDGENRKQILRMKKLKICLKRLGFLLVQQRILGN